MKYYVYILTTKNNKMLYIGMTNNLSNRVLDHKQKSVRSFTSKYNITKLIYYEEFEDVYECIAREKQLKGWTRIKKEALIRKFNLEFKELYEV